MSKKKIIILAVIVLIAIVTIALAFGMEKNDNSLPSDVAMRINGTNYSKQEFEKFLAYSLYANDGIIEVDEEDETVKNLLSQGYSKNELYKEQALEAFYNAQVYNLYAKANEITLTEDEIKEIADEYTNSKEKLDAYGITEEEFKKIAGEQYLASKISYYPAEYVKLPEDLYSAVVESFSGEEQKSYSYRILNVNYTEDTVSGEVSGETSGEIIKGNKEEKLAYINSLVESVKNGATFESISGKGDARYTFGASGIISLNGEMENAVSIVFKDMIMNEELYNEAIKLNKGEMTNVVEVGGAFQVLYMENIEEGFVGEAKKEFENILLSQYAGNIVQSIIKDVEVNKPAISRIEIK